MREVHQLRQHRPRCPDPDPAGVAEHDPPVGRPGPPQGRLGRAADRARLVPLLRRPLLLGRRRWENRELEAPLVGRRRGAMDMAAWLALEVGGLGAGKNVGAARF